MEKPCKACGETKPTTEFHKDRSKTDGLNSYCKPCQIARQKSYFGRPPRKEAPEGMKWCGRCKQHKPLEQFNRHAGTFDNLEKRCRHCSIELLKNYHRRNPKRGGENAKKWRKQNPDRAHDHHLKAAYGLPYGAYSEMLDKQSGGCAICKRTDPGIARLKHFHVDHCHETGSVRGLLCHGCNVSLGHFRHDPNLIQLAINYLNRT